jgi:citronellol/citronellal dehydrogenase
VIDTNLNGTCYMMQAAAQRWRDRKHPGSIVNIVVVTTHGLYGIAHTIAARSGVIGLSRSVAVEWAPLNIRVNCVAPGAIETEGWNVYMPQARTVYPRSNPMMRAGSPWDIAQACVYLAGPSGGFITGETLTVDGGGQLWGETWTTAKRDILAAMDEARITAGSGERRIRNGGHRFAGGRSDSPKAPNGMRTSAST